MVLEKITEEQFSTTHAKNGTAKLKKCCHNLFIFLDLELRASKYFMLMPLH